MIGELFETGVFSAIRDWKIVIESIMATPRREILSKSICHVVRSKRTNKWNVWRGAECVKKSCPWKRRNWECWRSSSTLELEQKVWEFETGQKITGRDFLKSCKSRGADFLNPVNHGVRNFLKPHKSWGRNFSKAQETTGRRLF